MAALEMVITDLDRTLLDDNQLLGKEDRETLDLLGESGILRVIATGRSLFSARKVLSEDFPIDYLLFSSGAGIMDWKRQEIIFSSSLPALEVEHISQVLKQNGIDFMVHYPIPENYRFYFHASGRENPDFQRRLDLYREYAQPLNETVDPDEACQIIAVLPPDYSLFKKIAAEFTAHKVIRTTSPLDHSSIWMEIFPESISKGHSVEWLARRKNIPADKTLGIGNDYNDIDLLEWTGYSFVVENAPDDLKEKYRVTLGNCYNGFSRAVKLFL